MFLQGAPLKGRYSQGMQEKLGGRTAALLVIPPLLWAGNAVVGRMVHDLVPPLTLNFLRWLLAFALLLPLAHQVLRRDSGLWSHWRRYALLGLLGIGLYNAFQYMIGALLSMTGVLLVLSRGEWSALLALRLVPGDVFMLLATICWAFYSWLLVKTSEPARLRGDWAAFLMAQLVFGLGWSGMLAGGEWATGRTEIVWGWPLVAALAFIAIGPAVLAYRCWGIGVQRAGPTVAGFFANLTPLFAALLSAAFLGQAPHAYHAAAFALIVGGIVVSSRRA